MPSAGAQAHDVLQRRLVEVQFVDLMLGEIADAQFGGAVSLPSAAGSLPGQQLGKRRFALAVAAQKRDAVVLVDAQVQAFRRTGGPP
jgi:hypothetical protein